MDLNDKAESSPDVSLARQSAPGLYRLETTELVPANELTAEGDFPQYGDFLEVSKATGTPDSPSWAESQFIECPQGLAQWLVETGIETGEAFRVLSVSKVDGEWQYECEAVDLDD